MTEDEKEILEELKTFGGRANAEMLSQTLAFPIRYIQHVLRNLHEARFLKVDTLARYPMYQMKKLIKRRSNEAQTYGANEVSEHKFVG